MSSACGSSRRRIGRLKKLVAERDLEIEVMKEVAAKNGERAGSPGQRDQGDLGSGPRCSRGPRRCRWRREFPTFHRAEACGATITGTGNGMSVRTAAWATIGCDHGQWRTSRGAAKRPRVSSKNSKANRIETGERSGGIGEICSVEVEENSEENS